MRTYFVSGVNGGRRLEIADEETQNRVNGVYDKISNIFRVPLYATAEKLTAQEDIMSIHFYPTCQVNPADQSNPEKSWLDKKGLTTGFRHSLSGDLLSILVELDIVSIHLDGSHPDFHDLTLAKMVEAENAKT